MKKIVFLESISKQYLNLQDKIRKNKKMIDSLKIMVTVMIFFLTLGVYGYFVNISSTKGYFLREQRQKLQEVKFSYNITQLEILKMEKKLWQDMNEKPVFDKKKISIKNRVINIPVDKKEKQLSKN